MDHFPSFGHPPAGSLAPNERRTASRQSPSILSTSAFRPGSALVFLGTDCSGIRNMLPRANPHAESSPAAALAVLAGVHADLFLEDDAHVLDVLEPGAVGDGVEGEVGLHEQFLHPLEAGADDLLVGAAAQELAEGGLEHAAGHAPPAGGGRDA